MPETPSWHHSRLAMTVVPTACARIADSARFQGFIFGVIVANAIVLGPETYGGIEEQAGTLLAVLNDVCLGIFVVELAIRITAYGNRPRDFFRDGWNVFDFVVITAAFAPGLRQNATLLRLVRLLRIVRIISVLPDVRVLLRGMVRSLPPIAAWGCWRSCSSTSTGWWGGSSSTPRIQSAGGTSATRCSTCS